MPQLARRIGAALVACAFAAFVSYVHWRAGLPLQRSRPEPVRRFPFAFQSNAECGGCHSAIAAECADDEHARAWFNGPLFPQDPRRTECAPCHASEPVLETGLDKPAVVRTSRHEEGIGCIECHRCDGSVRGPLPTREAACNPARDARLSSSQACAPCHAPHGTLAEWSESSWGKRGVTCQACHMPEVDRPSADGGLSRRVRSHRMLSPRTPAFLEKAVSAAARIEDGRLHVSITNDGTGHNFPGEIFNREAFLLVVVRDPDGNALAQQRESFRTPSRPQRGSVESTQIRAGETRDFRYDLPDGRIRISARIGYKLFFLSPDDRAATVWQAELER